MEMQEKNLLYRYLLFLIGLFIASMGVAFSTKAGLGTSPVASVPYSVSLVSNALTFGGWLNLLSLIQIIIQVILMKGRCIYTCSGHMDPAEGGSCHAPRGSNEPGDQYGDRTEI